MGTVKLGLALMLVASAWGQMQIDYPTQVARKPMPDLREYQFTMRNTFTGNFGASGDLSVAGSRTITLTPCPKGLAGTNASHYVYISGGTGIAEAALITGGTCTSALETGTIVVTTANTHTGAWTVSSATSGIKEACELMGSVHVPFGTYTIHAPVICPNPTITQGVGQGDSVLACSNLLTAPMFATAATGEGYRWSGLTLDMNACPSAGAFSWVGETIRPMISNVRVIYPNSDANIGKALYTSGPGEIHVTDFIVNNAGYCVDMQADNTGGPGTEYFFDTVICDSPTISGVRLLRTNASDVGGFYLNKVKITNPAGRTAKGFEFTSSAANTANVLFCNQCVADNIKGGPALEIYNQAAQHYINSWFVSGATAYGSTGAGIRVHGTTTEINFTDIQAQGHADGLSFGGTVTSVRVIGGKYSGVDLNCATGASCAIHIDSDAVLNNFDIRGPIIDEEPYTNLPEKLALSGQQLVSHVGPARVNTLNNQGLRQMFCLQDITTGADPTGIKCLGINNLGWFEMRNSLNQDIFIITDAGIPAFVSTDRVVIGGSVQNTTLIFPVPDESIALTFPATGDTMVGRSTNDSLYNKVLVLPTISADGWQNANHDHTEVSRGGQLTASAITGGFTGSIQVLTSVGTSTASLNYKDHSGNNASSTVVVGVNYNSTVLTFINGILQP